MALGISDVALKNALWRLAKAGRVASPRRGFHVIVPPEYRVTGSLPVVAYRSADPSDPPALEAGAGAAEGPAAAGGERRYWTWAPLMRRAFDIDVLACPRCGGRLRLLALIEDLGLAADAPGRAPPKVLATSDLHT